MADSETRETLARKLYRAQKMGHPSRNAPPVTLTLGEVGLLLALLRSSDSKPRRALARAYHCPGCGYLGYDPPERHGTGTADERGDEIECGPWSYCDMIPVRSDSEDDTSAPGGSEPEVFVWPHLIDGEEQPDTYVVSKTQLHRLCRPLPATPPLTPSNVGSDYGDGDRKDPDNDESGAHSSDAPSAPTVAAHPTGLTMWMCPGPDCGYIGSLAAYEDRCPACNHEMDWEQDEITLYTSPPAANEGERVHRCEGCGQYLDEGAVHRNHSRPSIDGEPAFCGPVHLVRKPRDRHAERVEAELEAAADDPGISWGHS